MITQKTNSHVGWLLLAAAFVLSVCALADAEVNTFYAMVNMNGYVEEGSGDGAYPDWYYYRFTNWWNVWFYNGPYDPDRKKVIDVSIAVAPDSPVAGSYIEIAYNWSSPEWPGGGDPPLPESIQDEASEELYIKRHTFKTLEVIPPNGIVIQDHFEVDDYNPEWVSIDIRGTNVIIDGTIDHRCVEKPVSPQACCFADGSCLDLTPDMCTNNGGVPQGAGTDCATTTCAQPTQACCFPDGSCMDVDAATCKQMGGIAQGAGTDCATTTCPQPLLEACCLPDGTCIDAATNDCLAQGGTPQGPGTDCTTVDCQCGWQPEDGHKMHFPQLPDPQGWDIDVTALGSDKPWGASADDWMCTQTGPVEDIHFWHSWQGDDVGIIDNIHVCIRSNITVDDPLNTYDYSIPGEILWEKNFKPDEFSLCFWGEGDQGFIYCLPDGWVALFNNHKNIYQCDIVDIPDPFIQQEGRIYWLQLDITVRDSEETRIGWKTSTEHFEDHAVAGSAAGGWGVWALPDGGLFDLAFVITGGPEPHGQEFGDAPEASLAYPDSCVQGAFPTCINIGPAGWIQHSNIGLAYFGPSVDPELDGNAGQCPVFAPNNYDRDECFQDSDAGLIMPPSYTIQGAVGSETVVPCVASQTGSLGKVCQSTVWGQDVDIDVVNNLPQAYVNVLADWNRNGAWGGSSTCPSGILASEHVLKNFPVPAGYVGPLSGLNPPNFTIGPYPGHVWFRFTISDQPAPEDDWNGEEYFAEGETEDYLLHIERLEKPYKCYWNEGDDHKMHWPQLPDLSPTGLDIDMFWTYLADDFLCAETGPIKDIHIWGSFADDCLPPGGVESLTFQVTIYSNVPADDLTPHSRPGIPLWTREFVPCEYTAREVADDIVEGWFDPVTGFYDPVNHSKAYQFNFCIEEDPFIQQEGEIYWLEVVDIPPAIDEPGYTFGWKTTTVEPNDLRWNDDAVWLIWDFGWWPLTYPDIPGTEPHPYGGQTLDLAFVITGEAGPPPELDFGDAPELPYPTTLAADGARHILVPGMPGVYLGNGVDSEPDGQPDATATGDDNDGNDDEDGVVFTSSMIPGQLATVDVTANAQGFLDAWVDFNGDGSWAQAGDQIFAVQPLAVGLNTLTFPVPPTASANITSFARFRFSLQGGLSYTGLAGDGEVEDYKVEIKGPHVPEIKPPLRHLKWSQPPIEIDPALRIPVYCGWDEPSFLIAVPYSELGLQKIVADDFRCIGSMPVASVHWWGSHLDWDGAEPPHLPKAFHIGFWTNVAPGHNPDVKFSYPGKLIQDVYCYDYDYEFVGYDRFPKAEQLIADNPDVTVQGNEDFNWTSWGGWWIRGDSTGVEFTFAGLDPATIPGTHVLVKFNLGVTNHVNGEAGLDGLVDVTINPGLIGWTYTVQDVLLDNIDPTNHIYAMGTSGTYETTASVLVPKNYIQGGALTIKVHRHKDVKDSLPAAPVSTNQPIDISTAPPTVPIGCYDFDDAHTVHINVATDAKGTSAANGEVTLWAAQPESCFQYYAKLDPNDYFWQEDYLDDTQDNVYWISIAAVYDDISQYEFPWGWKTRSQHWMDDAVTISLFPAELKPGLAPKPSHIDPIEDASLCDSILSYDMAFELDTDPNYIKWEQPFTGIRRWPHYEDEESIAIEHPGTQSTTKWIQNPDLSELGIDVDATTADGDWRSQILADDFLCTDTGPLTDIHIWGSWWNDVLPEQDSSAVVFTLSIHADIPASKNPIPYSRPGELLWQRQFGRGEFSVELVPSDAPEGYYSPCTSRYESSNHQMVFKYSFSIDRAEAFMQTGSEDKPIIYWLSVQAQPKSLPGIVLARFGWKTSLDHWNDYAVWDSGSELPRTWTQLWYPQRHPFYPGLIDLAFEIGTTGQATSLMIRRLVSDDWKCRSRTPVTAAVWWGSYIGYEYQACSCPQQEQPARPDYFLLSIWTDVPDPNLDDPTDYSHPGKKTWEYKARDFDEVLVGFDKHPHGKLKEPVYRYSVRLPMDKWFCQKDVNDIYWFSVVAVYKGPDEPRYPWGWTNHKCSPWEPPGLVEVAYWTMDETSGTTAHDSSGNANHGTLVGDAKWVPGGGRLCGAIDLDGDGDYVKTADTTTGLDFAPGSFSVSAWIYPRQVTGGWITILEYDRHGVGTNWFGIWLSALSKFHFRVGQSTHNSSKTLSANQWYLVTATYDSVTKSMNLYIDGQYDSSGTHSTGYASPNAAKLTIGVRGWEDAEYFDGLIDDVRIYDRVLSDSEIQALANMTRNDDAVDGVPVWSDSEELWYWQPLRDQTGASEDMSFVLFTEPGCFPCGHEDYHEWLNVGKPDCWCYPRQCHGDADNTAQGKKTYWVSTRDLDILIAAWNKPFSDIEGKTLYGVPLICADFDHEPQGKNIYRVSTNDLDILIANWNKAGKPDPNCP